MRHLLVSVTMLCSALMLIYALTSMLEGKASWEEVRRAPAP